MVEIKIIIDAESPIDMVPRNFGLSIDEDLAVDFLVTERQKVVGTGFKTAHFDVVRDVLPGGHRIIIGNDADPEMPWTVEAEIPKILWGKAQVSVALRFETTFTLPEEVPPEALAVPVPPVPTPVPPPTPVPTPPPTPVVPVVQLPSLPWYAAWLQPVISYMGLLTESVSNYFAPIFLPIKDAANYIKDIPANLVSAIITSISAGMKEATEEGIKTAIDTTKEIATGTPEWMEELYKNLEPVYTGMISGYSEALSVSTYEKSPLTGEAAVLALDDMKNKLLATAITNFNVHVATEAASLGQFEFMSQIEPMIVNKFGLNTVISLATMLPIEKAILKPAEYEYNTRYTPEIPSYADLINMVVKEVISLDDFKLQMAKLGFSGMWSQNIWDAHFIPPNWTQILQAYYRGAIDRETAEKMRILVDLDPRYNVIWDAQVEVIPSYTELTNELVKEVIDLPTYEKYLMWWGYNKEWAKRIWDAHFIPPSLGDILTAWRRDIIAETDVDKLMLLVDLDPRFKDIFDTRKYVDPSLSLTRFLFETGAISVDEIPSYVHKQGYTSEHEKAITDFIIRFQERRYRTRYLTTLIRGVSTGAYTADELTIEAVNAGYTKDTADWMVKIADATKKINEYKVEHPKPKLLSVRDVEKAYILDKITVDQVRTELLTRGYMVDEVDLKIQLMDYDKYYAEEGKKVVALSIGQMLNAYRYGEMSRDELLIKLQTRGLALDESEMLITTKEKQWGMVS